MRPVLQNVSPNVQTFVENYHSTTLQEVIKHVASDKIVVVGMTQNPVVKKARKMLTEKGLEYTYLEYGSYFSMWKERLAIKMWSGWPTFPQVFIHGSLVGGADDLAKLFSEGKIQALLEQKQ
jgi:glutaredoxin-related protein